MDFSREDFAEGLFEVVEVSTAKYDCSILVECIALKAVFQVFIYFRVLESSGFGKADQFWKWRKVYFVFGIYFSRRLCNFSPAIVTGVAVTRIRFCIS